MDLPVQRVKSLKFTVIGKNEALQQSKACIKNQGMRGNQLTQQNLSGTINDSHLGTMSKTTRCSTCNHTKQMCQGHNGTLNVGYPFILPQFEQQVFAILKRVCINNTKDGSLCLGIMKDSATKCSDCSNEMFKPIVPKLFTGYRLTFTRGTKGRGKDEKVLTIAVIVRIFSSIKLEKARREFGCEKGLSEFIQNILIIPSPINRPERRVNSKGPDDMTASLSTIVQCGVSIRNCSDNGEFEKLYSAFVKALKNYQIGDQKEGDDQKSRSLTSSLCGKEGAIRSGMLGKRVNKIGRAVAACDASNTPDEATLPQEFVKTVTIKETLRDYNRERLLKAYNIGPGYIGGSDAVTKPEGTVHKIKEISDKIVQLRIGDTLHRYLQNGDRVIICRQPSLLQNSLGSHRIKIALDETKDTIDINTLAVSQYHADFDG